MHQIIYLNMNDNYLKNLSGTEVAIIGMAFRFPGVKNEEEFWNSLIDGKEMVHYLSDSELKELGVSESVYKKDNYIRLKVEDIYRKEYFDNNFFGYTPKESIIMDPQIRIGHELVWEAIENSAYAGNIQKYRIGIFLGSSSSFTCELLNYISGGGQEIGEFGVTKLSNKDFLSSRIAYGLNLKGPCYSVQTACSTSLVSIHIGIRSLLTGECNMAIAGGISSFQDKNRGYIKQENGIISKDGHCRTFDIDSSGTIFGEGGGIIILKRLKDAIKDRDYIHAVIKGSAINNDGDRKVGYTAPSIEGQKEVIQMAHKISHVNPESISYIETHGTATNLGDPVEVEALRLAFNKSNEKSCFIGSVKSNFGHLDTAAGIAGLVKTVLMLKNKKIPPTVHFKEPNPKLNINNTPFHINKITVDWDMKKGENRRAGVSSFGIGGTNAHVVLEEFPDVINVSQSNMEEFLISISAKTKKVLQNNKNNLLLYLKKSNDELADIAYTLNVGRKSFPERLFAVASNKKELTEILQGDYDIFRGTVNEEEKPIVFMFGGQGFQYFGICKGLYERNFLFKKNLDFCLNYLSAELKKEILSIILDTNNENLNELNTSSNQPLIFIIEYALAKTLIELNIKPDVMIGHSLGEYVAACLSGIIELEDCIKLIVKRGALMQNTNEGLMLSVNLNEKEIEYYLNNGISIAAINSNSSVVVSGSKHEVEALMNILEKDNIAFLKLNTDRAFHSELMDPILKDFEGELLKINFSRPKIPIISNLTGNFLNELEQAKPDYWIKHLRSTVLFSKGLDCIKGMSNLLLLELGSNNVLSGYFRKAFGKRNDYQLINLIRKQESEVSDNAFFLKALGTLWLSGKKINWEEFYCNENRKRIPLPTYAFENRRFKLEQDLYDIRKNINYDNLEIHLNDNKSSFYAPSWKKVDLQIFSEFDNFVFFKNDTKSSKYLVEKLKSDEKNVVFASKGNHYIKSSVSEYVLGTENDYTSFFKEILKNGFIPDVILHTWLVKENNGKLNFDIELYNELIFDGIYSLFSICKSINLIFPDKKIQIKVLTSNAHEVIGEDLLSPLSASISAILKVINIEYPNITTSTIDIDCNDNLVSQKRSNFYNDIKGTKGDQIIAYRRGYRWKPSLEPINIDFNLNSLRKYKTVKNIVITGGIGGIGFEIVKFLSEYTDANLVLINRTNLPPRNQWSWWLENADKDDTIYRSIKTIKELEKNENKIYLYSCDISDFKSMSTILSEVENKLGPINGVIHAAGSSERSIIENTTVSKLKQQLDAKVKGLIVINTLLCKNELLFFINFSSINSIFPEIGQAGYSSANAILDAYSHLSSNIASYVKTINWNTWNDVGMAREYHNQNRLYLQNIKFYSKLPLIDYSGYNDKGNLVFITYMWTKRFWVLDEHRVLDGYAVMPGTAYCEIIYEAFQNILNHKKIQISNIFFIKPFIINDIEKKIIETEFEYIDGKYSVKICSYSIDNKLDIIMHLKADVTKGNNEFSNHHNLDQLLTKSFQYELKVNDLFDISSSEFGPRWNNCYKIKYNENSGLAFLKINDEFKEDLDEYMLHPAILDIATGFLAMLKKGNKKYLPFFYEEIDIHETLSQDVYSYSILRESKNDNKSISELIFDIYIYNMEGEEIITVKGLTFISYDESKIENNRENRLKTNNDNPKNKSINEKNIGLSTHDNIEIFKTLLELSNNQTIIFNYQNENRDKYTVESDIEEEEISDSRENINTEYVAPQSDLEKQIVEVWEKLFGIKKIGINDDFFDLGGDSVKVATILNKLNSQFKVNISLSVFFKMPTVKLLAIQINKSNTNIRKGLINSEKKEYYQLSSAQRRLYFIELLHSDKTLYNITEGFIINERVNIRQLNSAFNKLVQRHDSLRTSIVIVNDKPFKKIHDFVEVSIIYKEIDEKLIEKELKEFRKPFALETAPFIRVGLFKIKEEKYYVIIDLLHMIADGTSLLIIMNELKSLFGNNKLAPLKFQFSDFTEWQNRLLMSPEIENQKEFWRKQLSGQLNTIELPFDYTETKKTIKAGNIDFEIDSDISKKISEISKINGCTNFMLILAYLNIFFHKISNQNDILIGVPHMGRNVNGTSNLVGMFINNVLLRNKPTSDKNFLDFLQEVKLCTLGSFDNVDLQYEMILNLLKEDGNVKTDNLFNVVFNYRNFYVDDLASENSTKLNIGSAGIEDNIAKFDLTIFTYDRSNNFSFTFNYAESKFSAETIHYFKNEFIKLVEQITLNPNKRISDYSIFQKNIAPNNQQSVFEIN
ncbi:MAG: hypothetical protein A2X00_10600 [Bacteroidetes bacterium GWE2_32_14]|nr:MAG: hypothetical protein A2X00_10600 [Bacteroidetes bacterium GWE2_32_14]